MRNNKDARTLRTMRETVNVCDDYTCGLYNGLELAIAILESREPELVSIENEPQIYEAEEKEGRTIYSGHRRLSE